MDKVKYYAEEAWEWLATSSEDPRKLSLTLRGFVPFAVLLSVWFGADMNEGDLNSVADAVATALVQISALGTAGAGCYGALRKVYNTIKRL